MHKTFLIKLLFAFIMALPTLSAAADNAGAVESKGAAPARISVGVPQLVTTENKPAATTAAQPSAKIGYVDVTRIGVESERGKALKTLLTTRKDQLQGKVDSRKKQIEKFKASVESKIQSMTPQQREAKAKEFQKKLEEFQKFAQTSEEELFRLQDRETKELYEDIEKSAVAHGKANGFAVIVVKKELLYVGSSVDAQDVTDALIKALNEAGPKK
ncbi:MAG: OmpH family outer membrane protein [Deltaproteobacteria bacterium]|nr:OmpH family outer membrane protein [Deltaproteobacteria bacterium]